MSRVGYLYEGATPGNTSQAFDLHAFLSANLTTWTVGPIQTIIVGSDERNYFVLTHASTPVEILIYAPQGTGTSSDVNAGIDASYRETLNVPVTHENTLSFAAAPQGGYAASFVSALDPNTLAFWPVSSSKVYTIDYWYRSQPSMNLYIIENTAHAELFVYAGYTIASSGAGLGLIGYSAQMHTPLTLADAQSDSFMYIGTSSSTAGAPKTPRMAVTFWDTSWTMLSWTTTTTTQYPARLNLTALTDSNQPASDGSYLTKTVPFIDAPDGRYLGTYDPEILSEVGRMTATYGSKRGPAATPWIHVWIDYFTVWTQNLGPPVVG